MYTRENFELQKTALHEEIKSVLDDYDVDYEDCYIDEFLDTWYNAKAPLLELLSKHKSFIPEELAIVFDADYVRKADIVDAMEELRNMCDNIYWNLPPERRSAEDEDFSWLDDLVRFSRKLQDFILARANETGGRFSGMIDETTLAFMKDAGKYDGNASSAKLSRVLRKYIWQKASLFEVLGLSRRMEQQFATMADMLNDASITRHTVLSLHPCDYLLMSNGQSWRSCHMIPDGEWSAGTISYAWDKTSSVFYTVDRSYDNTELRIFRQPKIHRQMYFYDRGRLFQARLYPSNCQDDVAIDNYRHTVQQIFADCLAVPNLWTLKHYEEGHRYMETGENSCQYRDYYCMYDGRQTLSINQCMETPDRSDPIVVGAKTYNFCGDELAYNCTINDNADDTYWCEACQEYHRGEPYGYVHNDAFCEDAYESGGVLYCEWCDEYEWADDCTTVHNSHGWEITVCNDCRDNYYTECPECGEYYPNDSFREDAYGNIYCPDCWYDCVSCCEHCEEYYPTDDLTLVDGNYYCDDCLEQMEKEAE